MRPALDDTERLFRSERRRQVVIATLIVLAVLAAAGVLVFLYAPLLGRR